MAVGATRKQKAQGAGFPWQALARGVFGACLLVGVISLLGLAGWQLRQMPVERVIVSGDLEQVSRDLLMERVTESIESGFLTVNLQQVRRSVEGLPWVYRVVVKRRWPNSLEVKVTEQLPIARWGDEGYLNHSGELFLSPNLAAFDLPRLSGPQGTEQLLMQYYKMIQDPLHGAGVDVAALAMDRRGGLRAELVSGGELVFGRGDIAEKLQRFLRVYDTQLAGRINQVQRVDLRYSHGAAVAWVAVNTQQNKQKT
jgi:cell division protein FtsQ